MIMNAIIFTTLMLLVFAFLFIRTAIHAGSIKGMIAYYKENAEYRDWLGLLYIPAGIMSVLFVISLLIPKAEASENIIRDIIPNNISYLNYTSIYAGLETPIDSADKSVFCRDGQSDSLDNRMTSNLGIRQHLIGYNGDRSSVDVIASYTHHSCAIDKDQHVYDAIGIQAVWTFYWK